MKKKFVALLLASSMALSLSACGGSGSDSSSSKSDTKKEETVKSDKKADEAITMADIEPYKEQITPGKIVLFNTNWYKKRGTEEFFHHPYVNGEVAHYLVEQGVRFIGIDTINADQTGGTEFPVHDLFSEKRLMIGENWAYFDQIDFENPYIIAIPMKVVGCDGSPVRAIAVEWED